MVGKGVLRLHLPFSGYFGPSEASHSKSTEETLTLYRCLVLLLRYLTQTGAKNARADQYNSSIRVGTRFIFIARAQSEHPVGSDYYFQLGQMENFYCWVKDAAHLYILQRDTPTELRIRVAAHCGLGKHRGTSGTKQIICKKVIWPTTESNVNALVNFFLV